MIMQEGELCRGPGETWCNLTREEVVGLKEMNVRIWGTVLNACVTFMLRG